MATKRTRNRKAPTLYDLFHKDPFAGSGIPKGEEIPRNFKNFFKFSWRHFSHIVSVNLCFIFANFPLILLLLAFSGMFSEAVSSPASSIFPLLMGQMEYATDPVSAALYGIHGVQGALTVTTTATQVLYILGGVLLIFTFGPANTGTSYILRNLVKGDPIFFKHDFFYAIKRNLRQSFLLGILDLVILILFGYNILFYYFNLGYSVSTFMFYAMLLLALTYLVMRFYMYIVMITFDLSIFKIIKNAFIFAALGLKRNILALLGIIALALLDYLIMIVLLPLGVLLPFVILYGYGAYMGAYAAWPMIQKYMIDPYPDDTPKKEEDAIFTDDVTPQNQ